MHINLLDADWEIMIIDHSRRLRSDCSVGHQLETVCSSFWELILVICALLAVAALERFLTVQWLFETVITQETVWQTGNAGVPFTGFKFQSPAVIVVHFCFGCTDLCFLFGDFVCLGFCFFFIYHSHRLWNDLSPHVRMSRWLPVFLKHMLKLI